MILPDNDTPGRLHGEVVARGAARVAAGVSVLELPDVPEKGDVSDYLDAHKDAKFCALLKKVKPWVDPVPSLFLTAAELNAETPDTTPWIVAGLLAEGSSTELFGKPKMGKSTFTHCMIRAVLEGRPFLGRKTQKGPVVYLTEMAKHELMAELKETHLQDSSDLHILLYQRAMKLSWSEAVDMAIDRAKMVGAQFLIVDTFAKWTRTKEENQAGETLANFEAIDRTMAEGLAAWIESHERKAGGSIADAGRGSNALSGAVGTIVHLRLPEGKHPRSYRALNVIGRYEAFYNVLNWTGDEYVFLGTKDAVAQDLAHTELRSAMPASEKDALTVPNLLRMLTKPGDKKPSVSRSVVQRVLREWQDQGIVVRVGTSTKKDPFRYYIRAAASGMKKEKF